MVASAVAVIFLIGCIFVAGAFTIGCVFAGMALGLYGVSLLAGFLAKGREDARLPEQNVQVLDK